MLLYSLAFGPSGVRALPLAACTNEGGHYFCYIFPVSLGGRAEGLACADPGARTPIGASGNLHINQIVVKILLSVLREKTNI